MKDKKSDKSRRKLLKSIAAGSGAIVAGKSLPESWSRPVVDSVMLPAHAETSFVGPTGGSSGNIDITSIDQVDDNNMLAKISDKFINSAHAGSLIDTYFYRWTVCVTPPSTDGGKYTVQVMFFQEEISGSDLIFRETVETVQLVELAIGESKKIPGDELPMSCGGSFKGGISVRLDSYSKGAGSVTITADGFTQTVKFGPGGCMLDKPDCYD